MKTTDPTFLLECDNCKSHNVVADRQGQYVCHDCGMCSDEPMIQFDHEALMKDRNGTLIHDHTPSNGSPTMVGCRRDRQQKEIVNPKKINRISRMQYIATTTPEDEVFVTLCNLCATFEFQLPIHQVVKSFKSIYPQIPKCRKTRNIKNLSTVLAIITLTNEGHIFKLLDILDWAGMKVQDYYQFMRQINAVNPDYHKVPIETMEKNIFTLVHRIKIEFRLNFETFLLAKKLVKYYRHWLGNTIRIIASSAVLAAMELRFRAQLPISDYLLADADPIPMSRIAKFTTVSASTISKYKQKFPYQKIVLLATLHPSQSPCSPKRPSPMIQHIKATPVMDHPQEAKLPIPIIAPLGPVQTPYFQAIATMHSLTPTAFISSSNSTQRSNHFRPSPSLILPAVSSLKALSPSFPHRSKSSSKRRMDHRIDPLRHSRLHFRGWDPPPVHYHP